MLRRRGNSLLTGCLTLFSFSGLVAEAGSTNRLDHAWKNYKNAQQGYCVSYPSQWAKGSGFDGAGLVVETGAKKFARPSGEIDIAAASTKSDSEAPAAASVTLVDDLKMHLAGLAKFERAERMEVLDQHSLTLAGQPGLFTKDRYYDPLERTTWIEELVFARQGDVVYRLELECRADELERFEPVFTRFISTFQFDCAAAAH